MIISQLELNHFRNYDKVVLNPHEGVNIFFGQNGSGKTNLLEAIHYCSLGRSHRMNQDINAVQAGQPAASCRLRIQGKWSRNDLEIQLHPREDTVKTVWIDRKRIGKLSEMMGVLRCVIFSPEDLGLIKDGPSVRRKYLDMMICQVSRSYFIALQQYRIALNQRNAILRQAKIGDGRVDPMIEDFEYTLSEQARLICRERVRFTGLLSEAGRNIYIRISGRPGEDFQIRYLPSVLWEADAGFSMGAALKENRENDLRQGYTSIGPHRDDLDLTLNQKNMKLYASQGQMRTAALSLKLAQLQMIQKLTEDQPVLLLDDVMSELDLNRRMNLLELIDGTQTFITCSDEGDLASWQMNRTYRVFPEDGLARIEMIKEGSPSPNPVLQEPAFT